MQLSNAGNSTLLLLIYHEEVAIPETLENNALYRLWKHGESRIRCLEKQLPKYIPQLEFRISCSYSNDRYYSPIRIIRSDLFVTKSGGEKTGKEDRGNTRQFSNSKRWSREAHKIHSAESPSQPIRKMPGR